MIVLCVQAAMVGTNFLRMRACGSNALARMVLLVLVLDVPVMDLRHV
jgi:hypothetical protein